MNRRIFLIMALILFCCGCTADYTIKINEKLEVEESALILEDAAFYNKYENSSVQRVISFILEPNLDYLNANDFLVEQIIGTWTAGVKITNSYESIEKYKEVSKFSEQFADSWDYFEDGDEITLRIRGAFSDSDQDQSGKYLVNEATINIQLPFEVIDHNADNYNESTNTYTWNIDRAGAEKEIFITFDKTIKKDLMQLYLIIGGIIVVVLIIVVYVYGALAGSKRRNEI